MLMYTISTVYPQTINIESKLYSSVGGEND